MQRYRKDNTVVEAEQFKSSIPALTTAFNSGHPDNRYFTGAVFLHLPILVDELGPHLILKNNDGAVRLAPGDWLVKEGETWRGVSQEAFDHNYKPVHELV